jgi:DNA-directed RNA polymerase sigma subunit (sigma70/sigma32)
MEILEARERLVLRLRFGSMSQARTHATVARWLDVSDGAVRRIERQALRKLRRSALGSVGEGGQDWDEA